MAPKQSLSSRFEKLLAKTEEVLKQQQVISDDIQQLVEQHPERLFEMMRDGEVTIQFLEITSQFENIENVRKMNAEAHESKKFTNEPR